MLSNCRITSRIISHGGCLKTIQCSLAAPAKAAGGQAVGKKRFRIPVETDVNKLMNNCCGANYFKDGEPVKLKEDSEYPDWLWKLPTTPPRIYELDPNTKEYWEKAEIVGQQREWKLSRFQKKRTFIGNKDMIIKMELKYLRRFRALAKYHYNAGYDIVEHHEREDTWNIHSKDRYKLPDDPRPFYPGIDQVKLPFSLAQRSKQKDKIGHFGL